MTRGGGQVWAFDRGLASIVGAERGLPEEGEALPGAGLHASNASDWKEKLMDFKAWKPPHSLSDRSK